MKKNLRKGLSVLLAVMMAITVLPGFAFAETTDGAGADGERPVIPNFLGNVSVENVYCKEIGSLVDLNLEIQVTSTTDPAKSFAVPLAYDDMLEMYYVETYLDQATVPVIIDEILANQEAAMNDLGLDDETLDNMTDEEYENLDFEALGAEFLARTFAGYTVTVNGLGEDSHFRAELFDGGVSTGADQIVAFELIVALLGPEDGFAEGEEPTTIMALMDYVAKVSTDGQYETYLELLQDQYAEEEVAIMIAEVEAADELLAMARNGEYPNQLAISMTLLCDCPVMVDYEVLHQYLVEVDGKLVEVDLLDECEIIGSDDFYLQGELGQVVRSEDYVRTVYEGMVEEYAGKTFTYVGSYDSMSDWYDLNVDISGDALEEYTLSEDYDYDGFVLRYVLVEETEDEQDKNLGAEIDADKDKDEVITGGEDAPLTGDHTPVVTYTMLLATAFAALAAMCGLKMKRK